MRQAVRNPHLWVIIAIMVCGAIIYYADNIPMLQTLVAEAPIRLARYSTHRILSIIPVAYAAFVFGFRAGFAVTVFISLALLPRVLTFSKEDQTAVVEIVAFFVIGLLVSWLTERQRRAVSRLEKTQQDLTNTLQTVESQQRKLTSLYAISTMVAQTLDISEITHNTLHEVLQLTAAKAGWIYVKDDTRGDIALSAYDGLSREFLNNSERIKLGEHLDGRVAQSGVPLITEVNSREFGLRSTEGETTAIFVVPLQTATGTEGTLGIAIGDQHYSADELLQLLSALGNKIGICVNRARLRQQEKVITEQLRLSEERYRALFENASEAILACSTAGRIISANRSCERLTGYTQAELVGMAIFQAFSEQNSQSVRQLFSDSLATGLAGETTELSLIRKDGTEVYVRLKLSPLLKDDRVIGAQAIALDVTEESHLRRNMQYYISQVTRAVEAERLRISRELHDETAQVLSRLSRDLDSLALREKKLPKSTLEHLTKLREMADSALGEVRRYSQDLRPSILDDLGLVAALEWLVADLEKQSGMTTSVSITGNQRRLAPETELAIFRIAQEALSNVKKHSHASALKVKIDFEEKALTIVISDDGQGFNIPQRASDLALSGRLGIIGMRERAHLVGGTFIVQSEVGSGTAITLRVSE